MPPPPHARPPLARVPADPTQCVRPPLRPPLLLLHPLLISSRVPPPAAADGAPRAAWRGKLDKLTSLLDKYAPTPDALRPITSARAPGFTPLDLAVANAKQPCALLLLQRLQTTYHELDHLNLHSRTVREAHELLDFRGTKPGEIDRFEGEDREKIYNALREEQYKLLRARDRQPEKDPWAR